MENALPIAPARDGAPIYVTGELQWDRPALLEGRLRFVLRNGPDVLTAVETDPLVVTAGGTRFRQLIPVPDGVTGYGMSDIVVTFLADDVQFKLGEIGVRLAQPGAWESVVLCVEPTSGAGLGDAERLRRAMPFEQAFANQGQEFNLQTYSPTLAASDLSEQPLLYCPFDAILIPAASFARLSGRQLGAVADWVRAGGAACVVVDGPLEEKQVGFLDELFRDAGAGPFVRDEGGRLLEPDGTTDGVFASRVGLGYAVVLSGPADALELDTPAWREAHARLWRMRDKHVARRRDGRLIDAAMFQPKPGTVATAMGGIVYQNNAYLQDPRVWSVPAPSFGTAAVEALRPSAIRLMPGWTVVLILFGYVALVGPVDYLLLGRLRLRKWTWLTFPAVTLAVTGGVVATADAFMSSNDHVRAIDVIDLDANGEPVRLTRLEMLFYGASGPVPHAEKRTLFSRLDRAHFRVYNQYGQQIASQNDAPTGPYVGTLPSRYVVSQQISKWKPQVNRTFEIAPEVAVAAIDWERLEADDGIKFVSLAGDRTGHVLRVGSDGGSVGSSGPLGHVHVGTPHMQWQLNQMTISPGDTAFLAAATSAPVQERSSLQFQRAPLGLARLDDLPFADTSDEGTEAIVVWTQDAEGNITVYRKPILAGSSGSRAEADRVG